MLVLALQPFQNPITRHHPPLSPHSSHPSPPPPREASPPPPHAPPTQQNAAEYFHTAARGSSQSDSPSLLSSACAPSRPLEPLHHMSQAAQWRNRLQMTVSAQNMVTSQDAAGPCGNVPFPTRCMIHIPHRMHLFNPAINLALPAPGPDLVLTCRGRVW